MRGWRQSMAVGAWITWLCASAQAAETRPNVVVVQPEGVRPGAFVSQLKAIEAPLGKAVGVVPLADYLRAGKSLGLKPGALYGDESAVAVGRLVNASHVLFLKPVASAAEPNRGRTRGNVVLSVLLVDATTGESSLDTKVPVPRGAGAQARTAAQLVQAIVAACAPAASAPVPALAAPPPAVAASPAADNKKVAAGPKALPPPPALEAPIPPEVAQGSEVPAPGTQAPLPPPPLLEMADASAATAGPSFWEAEGRLPRGVEVALGALLYQRQSLLSEAGRAQLEYGATRKGSRPPMFARGTLDFTLLPSRWHKHRLNALDGFLLFGHLELGAARTLRSDRDVATLGSYALRVGAGYRTPLWSGPRAMAATLRVGFSQYLFASHAGVPYPAVGLRGVLVGLGLEAPLGTRHVALLGNVGVIAKPRPFAGAAQLGASTLSSLGGVADAGLRLSAGHVDVELLFSWERYSVRYAGESQSGNLTTQFISPALVDQNVGGKARLALHF